MAARTARIFVGNLPESVDEVRLKKTFEKFGNVLDLKVTSKENMPPFAHISLSSDSNRIYQGIQQLNQTNFDGSRIRVEEAKESFLERLKREQASNKIPPIPAQQPAPAPVRRLPEPTPVKPAADIAVPVNPSKKKKKRKRGSSDSEEEFSWKIKPFGGTADTKPPSHSVIQPEINQTVTQSLPSARPQVKKLKQGNDHYGVLKSLEGFSAEWGDSDSEKNVPKVTEPVRMLPLPKPHDSNPNKEQGKKHIDKTLKKEIDNQKRLKSLEERNKTVTGQKDLVKAALLSVDASSKSKKIVFDDQSDEEEQLAPSKKHKESNLFEDTDEDDFQPDFTDRPQFDGQQGKELFDMQSRFSKDDRFKLDQRFADKVASKAGEIEISEKERQLKILSEITGVDVSDVKRKDVMVKKSTFSRYDPTQVQTQEKAKTKKKKVLEEPKEPEEAKVIDEKAQERFFETTENLTKLFAEKGSFSLLPSFGVAPEVGNEEEESTPVQPIAMQPDQANVVEKATLVPPKNLWVEPFFLKAKDERFKEGQDFFFGNVEDPEEYRARWYEKRQDLVKIYRNQHRRTAQLRALKRRHTTKKRG